MIYVSHRMPEVFRLCDRLSVLRDGKYVGTLTRKEATQDAVVRMMIGRTLEQYFPQHLSHPRGQVVLSVRGLSSPGQFSDVSFDLHGGEILGFAGLVGSGRSEVAKAIFGLDARATGSIELLGEPMRVGGVRKMMRRGVGLVPEDRKRQGLVLMMSGRANISMASLDRLSRLGLLNHSAEQREALRFFEQLKVKSPSTRTPVAALSGGNQQKIALAKWLTRESRVLIVDEPTRGVDIAAKAAIHAIIDELARSGMGIILISSELPEVINLSTRILIMRHGRVAGEVARAEATQERVLRVMAGVEAPADVQPSA
jgi:ABC-type sugar transport system ATPase subunit